MFDPGVTTQEGAPLRNHTSVRKYGFKLEGGVNGLKRVFANFLR